LSLARSSCWSFSKAGRSFASASFIRSSYTAFISPTTGSSMAASQCSQSMTVFSFSAILALSAPYLPTA